MGKVIMASEDITRFLCKPLTVPIDPGLKSIYINRFKVTQIQLLSGENRERN